MHRHLTRRLLLAAGITTAALVAAAAPSIAAAQTGPLDGETLGSAFVAETMTGEPPPSVCDAGNRSTIYFSATGTAVGPFPGTFTETGTITLGPQNLTTPLSNFVIGTGLVGPVLTFEAQFEIHSGATTITGTKTLSATLHGTPYSSTAACASFENSSRPAPQLDPAFYATISGRSYFADISATYQATIDNGTTTSSVSGETTTNFSEAYFTGGTCQPDVSICQIADTAVGTFSESFYAAPQVTPPPPPVSGDCKVTYGGWITAQNGDRGSFAGQARSTTTTAPSGKQSYRDSGPAADYDFVSTGTTAVTCTADSAQIYGRGTVDGSPVTFRIELTDAGKDDTYRIVWTGATSYDSGVRPLRGGNITVH